MTTRTGGGRAISVDSLEPGMVLAEDVHDVQGRLLIPSGTGLTARHLRAFQLWGILGVKIQDAEGEGPPPAVISPEILAQAEALVRSRLRPNEVAHPVIAELFRICVLREARQLAEAARGHA